MHHNNNNNDSKRLALRTTLRTKRTLALQWLKRGDPLLPAVMLFLREHFHPNEPVNRSIDLMQHPPDVITLDVLYERCVSRGASVVAADENGNVVGVLLNDILMRGAEEVEHDDARWKPTPRYSKFLDVLSNAQKEMHLFEKYPQVDLILDHTILSVCAKWQGDGIGQMLVEFANDVIAREFNCGMSVVFCTSFYSARVFEKCGYREIWRKKCHDFRDGDEVLFPLEPPHEYFTYSVLELK